MKRLGIISCWDDRFPQTALSSFNHADVTCCGLPYHKRKAELVFEVIQEDDAGYCAECLRENTFTEGDHWEQLRKNVVEATAVSLSTDRGRSGFVCTLVRDEILSVA